MLAQKLKRQIFNGLHPGIPIAAVSLNLQLKNSTRQRRMIA
jgi:hypothetical protein